MKPRSPAPTRRDLAIVRQLSAALGVESPTSRSFGLLLGTTLIAVLGGGALLFWFGGAPPAQVYGVVQGFGLSDSYLGSTPVARVRIDDQEVAVQIENAATCLVGDRIKLYRRRRFLGYVYSAGLPRPCG